jgi:citrate synthase
MERMVRVNPLRDVVAAHTALSSIDGNRGRLLFRGLPATDLAAAHSFPEAAHFLWTGRFLTAPEPQAWSDRWLEASRLPDSLTALMDALPADTPVMSMLTAVTAAAGRASWPPTLEEALTLAARSAAVVGRWACRLRGGPSQGAGRADRPPDPVQRYLAAVTGREPLPAHVRALASYMILVMEHGLNASTYAARVVASTQADLASAVTGALAAMRGPLHGGAPALVGRMLDAIGRPERAEDYLRGELAAGRRIMGFGHRVYHTRDPRAQALRDIALALAPESEELALAAHVETVAEALLAVHKPGRALFANVEYWAAAVLRTVGIPEALYTPTFAVARTASTSSPFRRSTRVMTAVFSSIAETLQ